MSRNQVLKLYRSTFPIKAIEEEFQIGLALNGTGLDAPHTYEMQEIEGSRGIVFDYIEGKSMLEVLANRPFKVLSLSVLMAKLHWKLHRTVIPRSTKIPSLKESLADKISRVPLLTSSEKAAILLRLASLSDGSAICHGDFHPDNIIMSKGWPATVDWLTATIGNPIADVARTWLLLTMGTLPENRSAFEVFLARHLRNIFCDRYLSEYQSLSNYQSSELEQWKLSVGAARLIENVSDRENQNLLKFIRTKLADK